MLSHTLTELRQNSDLSKSLSSSKASENKTLKSVIHRAHHSKLDALTEMPASNERSTT